MVGAAGAMKQAMATNEPVEFVKIQRVSKQFDDALAVDDVTLTINRGEIFALLGGSGSGKSTLLRILAGFEKPTEGKVLLDGQNITDLPPHKRPINMMFQSYALFPHMTVEQNIAFGLKQDKLSKQEISERVAEMLKLVHMAKYAKRKPHQLSGGQRQRVALARSLAKRPKLLLLDEPMGALDKKLRSQMQLELVEIIERVGVTCIMVTHDQEEAMTMAQRIAIMDQGWIVQVGTPMDIYESPVNRHVAEFVGSVNIFEGEIIADMGDHMIIECPQLDRQIYLGHGVTTRAENMSAMYALRPEKVFVTTEQPEQEYNWAHGEVHDIAYLGGHSVYYIKLDSGKMVQAFFANSERRLPRPTWEDKVYVSWDDDGGVVLQS